MSYKSCRVKSATVPDLHSIIKHTLKELGKHPSLAPICPIYPHYKQDAPHECVLFPLRQYIYFCLLYYSCHSLLQLHNV